MNMKSVLAGALLALVPSLVLAQGLPSANTVYAGPTSGSPAAPTFRALVPADIPSSGSLDTICSTRGCILERGASAWQGVVPGTSGLPWVSNGTGADPGYQALTAAGLANITGPGVLGTTTSGSAAVGTLTGAQAESILQFTQSGTGATQRTVDSVFQEKWPSLKDFGAVCDGVTDDATALTNVSGAFSAVYLGPPASSTGTKCKVSTASTSLTGKLFGQNAQILDGSGNQRGYLFSAVGANQSYTATNEDNIETAFDGNFTGGQIVMEHRITGAATLTQPTSGYVYSPWAYPIYIQMLNSSGWNNGTADSTGRTMAAAERIFVNHQGQGDASAYNATCALGTQTKVGATSWLAEPSCAIFAGQAGANADHQNLTPGQVNMEDNGHDVSGIGWVVLSGRTVNTGALGVWWGAYISQSAGTKPIDFAFGGFGPHNVGLDFTGATFTAPNQAAIVLKNHDKIYLNGSSSNGIFATSVGVPFIGWSGTSGAIELGGAGTPTRVNVGTASTLPGCSAVNEGSIMAVTDANAATWGTAVVGGGANHILAYCGGTSWKIMGN